MRQCLPKREHRLLQKGNRKQRNRQARERHGQEDQGLEEQAYDWKI